MKKVIKKTCSKNVKYLCKNKLIILKIWRKHCCILTSYWIENIAKKKKKWIFSTCEVKYQTNTCFTLLVDWNDDKIMPTFNNFELYNQLEIHKVKKYV